jgi:hypothetical protein
MIQYRNVATKNYASSSQGNGMTNTYQYGVEYRVEYGVLYVMLSYLATLETSFVRSGTRKNP